MDMCLEPSESMLQNLPILLQAELPQSSIKAKVVFGATLSMYSPRRPVPVSFKLFSPSSVRQTGILSVNKHLQDAHC
jgi:hypothetical protein